MNLLLRQSRIFAIVFLIATLFISNVAFGQEIVQKPTVTLDQADLDYAPGETVYITGLGWKPGETVTLGVVNLTNPDVDCGAVSPHISWDIVADVAGNFSASWYVNDCELGAELFFEALGKESGFTFEIFFTDAPPCPSLDITSEPVDASKCVGENVTFSVTATALNGGVLSYQWQKGNPMADISGATGSNLTISAVTASDDNKYRVIVTETANCGIKAKVSKPVTLTVNPLTATPTITANGPTTFCYGGSVTLTSSIGTTYLWSNGDTTSSIMAFISGIYTVRVGNAAGCWSAVSTATAVTVYDSFTSGSIATTGQTICYNTDASEIGSTTNASGGFGPITYQWQSSVIGDFTDAVDITTNTSTYTPTAGLTTTTWYRRLAKDTTCNTTFETSIGTWKVTVYDSFTSGSIATTGQTICYNTDASEIGSTTNASGGFGPITYQWQSSVIGDFTDAVDIATNTATYTPAAGLTTTTWYRRLAKDTTCNTTFETSIGTWKVTVYPQFTSGSIETTGQTICYNTNAFEIGSTTPAFGGDGTISYSWRSSADGYTSAIDGATSATYNPGLLTVTTSFRRYVHDETCNTTFVASTGTWTVTVYDNYTAGAIATTGQTICQYEDPGLIGSTTPASGGYGSITYQWQSSTDLAFSSPTNISSNTATYDPPAGLSITTWYRCQAKDATCNTTFENSAGVWKVTVKEIPVISSQPIDENLIYGCNAPLLSVTATISTGTISYQWYKTTAADNYNGTKLLGETGNTCQTPHNYNVGLYYYYVVLTSNGCPVYSKIAIVTITPQTAMAVGDIYYTGPTMAWITSATSNSATVTLSATIKNGLSCGDIKTARITFTINGQPISSATNLPVGFIDPNYPEKGGTASAIVQLNISSNTASDLFEIGVEISGNYSPGAEYDLPGQVTVVRTKPGGVISGGTFLYNGSSSGYVKGINLSKSYLNFYVEYAMKGKSVTNPKGKVSLLVLSRNKPDGTVDVWPHLYSIKSNAIASLNIISPTATFSGKANIAEINLLTGVSTSIEGNCQMVLDLTDGPDQVGITIQRNSGGIWYSNNWVSTKTVKTNICYGEVNVTGAPPSIAKMAEPISAKIVESVPFNVIAYPNPAKHQFTLVVEGDSKEKVEIMVYDVLGRTLKHIESSDGQIIDFGQDLPTGAYFTTITQGTYQKTVRLIKQ